MTHPFYCELKKQLSAALEGLGIKADQVDPITTKIVRGLKASLQGIQIYFPKECRAHIVDRNREIRDRFDGSNKAEICRIYGLSERQLYRIMSRKN
jgi:Mor family transcriptional regulator